MLRIGLVLGAGGSVGLAFHGGVLAALEEATGWDPRSAEIIVGSSAGSLSGSLLRVGLPAGDLRGVSEGDPLSPDGQALAEIGVPHRPRAHLWQFLRPRLPADPVAAAKGIVRPWSRSPMATISAALPAGPVPTESISGGFDLVAGRGWPEATLWLTALRLRDGRRVVFGRPGSPEARLGQAVAASCAVPGYFQPVTIAGERYVDGGMASVHNADLLCDADLDLVVVSAPLAHAGHHVALTSDLAMRAFIRRQLDREVAGLQRRGLPVLVLAPTRRVVTAMGLDAMDARRRRLVSRMARTSTLDYLERSELGSQLAGAAGRTGTPAVRPHTPAA